VKKKIFAGVIATAALAGLCASPATAYSGPDSWSTAGLKEVVRYTGHLEWSIDGLGTTAGTGNIQVDKPAGAKLVAAYFVAAQISDGSILPVLGTPSNLTLNAKPVTFKYASTFSYMNYFADVTELLADDLAALPTGTSDIAVDEGPLGGPRVEGTELVVLWDDPTVDTSSVVLAFGNSNTAGDTFTLNFPALTTPQTQDVRLSIGDSYSYQSPTDSLSGTQSSVVTVNGTVISEAAGGSDDALEGASNGNLLSVGGIGDDLALPPTPFADPIGASPDDELYSVSSMVNVGDTTMTIQTLNASGNDNVFLDAFYLKHVELPGATAVVPFGETPAPDAAPALVNTGLDMSAFGLVGGSAMLLIVAGGVTFFVTRRKKA
jgi:hypothetical protein